MKKIYGLAALISIALLIGTSAFGEEKTRADDTALAVPQADEVDVNETNFPDAYFRDYVLSEIDKDGSKTLSSEEIGNVKEITLTSTSIASFQGIGYFTSLEYLNCSASAAKTIDLSKNNNLKTLMCFNGKMESLDLRKNAKLTSLDCHSNALTDLKLPSTSSLRFLNCNKNKLESLDLSKQTKLEKLSFESNKITSISLKNLSALKNLDCSHNSLTSLDLSGNGMLEELASQYNEIAKLDTSLCPKIVKLECYSAKLTSLDLRSNVDLEYLNCASNSLTKLYLPTSGKLSYLGCSSNALQTLDVSKQTGLESLLCSGNQIQSLPLGNLSALQVLICSRNELSALNLSVNAKLQRLECNSNPIAKLDLSSNPKLKTLSCNDTNITSLDVSNHADLTDLECKNCSITSINVSGCTKFKYINCSGNELTALNVSSLSVLSTLDCSHNKITTLNLSANTALRTVNCSYNFLTSLNVGNGSPIESLDCSLNYLTTAPALASGTVVFEPQRRQVIALDSENFPDPEVCAYLNRNVADNAGYLTFDQADRLTSLTLAGKEIKSLKGIELFKNLEELSCVQTQVSELDVSNNTKIKNLICNNNMISSLKLGENTNLQKLLCEGNRLTKLDVRKYTTLETLNCSDNALTSLQITGCNELHALQCANNQLTSLTLPDLSNMQYIYCQNNKLTSLSISNAPGNLILDCSGNQLTNLTFPGTSILQALYCSHNPLKVLDLGSVEYVRYLRCYDCQLEELRHPDDFGVRCIAIHNNRFKELNLYFANYSLAYDVEQAGGLQSSADDSFFFSMPRNDDGTIRPESELENWTIYLSFDKATKLTNTNILIPTPTPTPVTTKSVEVGKSFQYTVPGVSSSSITWSVGNTAVATVDASGKVTGKSVGNTYLHVGLPDGSTIKCLIKVVYPALSVRYSEKTLHINQTFQFTATGACGQAVTWRVGNTSVAVVDASGKVTGKKAANTYLYAKSADGREAKCLLKVIDPGVLGINYTEKTVYLGQSFTFATKNAGILAPTWSVGNTAVAKVDASSGKVTAVSVGNTYLYVKTADGRSARCLIKVVDPGALSIRYTEKTIKVGASFQFTATNTAGQTVSWRVGNTAVATVDANGKVTGKKVANTWLYATTPDGREVKCLIKVVA